MKGIHCLEDFGSRTGVLHHEPVFLLGERATKGEIESKTIGVNQGPGLSHALPQLSTERCMEKMRGGVIPLRIPSKIRIHHGRHQIPALQLALHDGHKMDDQRVPAGIIPFEAAVSGGIA